MPDAPGMQSIVGASLFSAAASLPLHLMPFIVAALAADSRISLAQAGWIATAFAAGQLICTVVLPTVGARRLGLTGGALAAATAAAIPWLAGPSEVHVLPVHWFALGAACGALQFLGATAAAEARDRTRAFGLRLCFILLVGGLATWAMALDRGEAGYSTIARQLGVVLAILGGCATWLYRPTALGPREAGAATIGWCHLPVLALVFVVFAAQPGFWAYAVAGAHRRGMEISALAYAISVCKIAAAGVLWYALRHSGRNGLLLPGAVLAAGVLLMASAHQGGVFFVGAILRELGVTLLSVRFQAEVVIRSGSAVGPWLAATVFAGAALGPLVHGWAIAADVQAAFIAFTMLAALLPGIWAYVSRPLSPAVS